MMATVPFLAALGPSAAAKQRLEAWTHPPFPNLADGQVLSIDRTFSTSKDNANGSWSPIWGKRDLLIRDYDGAYYSFRLPTWKDSVVIPRVAWGQWEGECKNFGPPTSNGMLLPGSIIQCLDASTEKWFTSDAKWSLDGKSLFNPYPDLPKLRCRKKQNGELECV